jgi:hypothetical protein
MHVILASGVHHEAAPSTPNVKESLPRLQPQLSADQVEFLFLGDIERLSSGAKVCARVRKGLAEPWLKERNWLIVVVRNRGAVSFEGML